jgi:DNA-binding CsgD family transcriptional regulator
MGNLTEILNRRSAPGVILFDATGTLRYVNQDARELIPSLNGEVKGGKNPVSPLPSNLGTFVEKMVSQPVPDNPFTEPFLYSAVIDSSWGVPLSLRGFLLSPNGNGNEDGNHQYLVLVEMIVENREINLFEIRKRFGLSDRESEVLQLVCAGCSNQEISNRLFISKYTVKDHIKHLKSKLGVQSRNLMVATINNR